MTQATDPIPIAYLVHRTAERWRLRVPARKRDLAYFIRLYEALRAQPEIQEVTVNPLTGSLLVWLAPAAAEALPDALTRTGLLRLAGHPAAATADLMQSSQHQAIHAPLNDTRLLVFLIMLALAAYQLSKKQFLAPALTLSLSLIELLTGPRQARDAAGEVETPPTTAVDSRNLC